MLGRLALLLALGAPLLAGSAQGASSLLARSNAFEPQRLEVDPGETILVTFEGEGHTFTHASPDPRFDTGLRAGNSSVFVTAPPTPGEYRFYCKFHAGPDDPVDAAHMTGVLVVRGEAPTPASPDVPGAGSALVLAAPLALALLLRRR